ncbi:MAG: hypothetical protein ACREMG_06050 [Gemmatimonadales bacterium]
MIRSLVLLLGAALAAGLAACERPRDVAVRVSIPGPDSLETPVSGIGLVALPYDRDSVLAALEAAAHHPRPATAALDSLFRQFRGPFTAYASATFRAGKLRDTLTTVKSALDSMPRNAPAYRQLYAVFTRLSDSLAAAQSESERARVELTRARADFVSRSESLRTLVRQWEDSTYRGYDSIVRNLALAGAREPITDTTRADGWAHFHLRPGRWWIYARSWDATDPNAEWYWNVPVSQDTMLLSSQAGRRQARY